MGRIIESDRSVIIAADVRNIPALAKLIEAVVGVPGIGSVKLGAILGLQGLAWATKNVRGYMGNDFPIIYDHQKWGNDIPNMGKPFAETLASAGITAAIIFPFTGPATQEESIKACFSEGIEVITGGMMTHPKFLVSEGGYIADEAVERIYRTACQLGVTHFVVPGNKLEWVKRIRAILVEELGEDNFTLYAPGFITQGGDISECGLAAGEKWHAIVGSAIYSQTTRNAMHQAAMEATSQIGAMP